MIHFLQDFRMISYVMTCCSPWGFKLWMELVMLFGELVGLKGNSKKL